jgi:outer membrane protein X
MKKVILSVVLICAALIVRAEEFKPFRVDLGLGYAIPKGGGGVLFSLEPKYSITPNISAGIRAEWAGMAKIKWVLNEQGQYVDPGDTEFKFSGSYLATGDYHFMTSKFRPFAGLGLGAYSVSGANITLSPGASGVTPAVKKTNFGFMLRAGFDISHCRLAAEYNFAGKDDIDKSCNYLSIKFSVYIGGGMVK